MGEHETGFHGLPAEYRTPDGAMESWEATLGYLDALAACQRAIVGAVEEPAMDRLGHGIRLSEQIGYLKHLPSNVPEVHRWGLNWPDREQQCGVLSIGERLFKGARLDTVDGDDYFGLGVELGNVRVVFLDANTNMDRAEEQWFEKRRQTYLNLPTPREIGEKLEAEPDRAYRERMGGELAALRADLVRRGGTAAAEMSDSELVAAVMRVKARLEHEGTPLEDETEWVSALAAALRRGEEPGG